MFLLTSKRCFTRADVKGSTMSCQNFFKLWNPIGFSSMVTRAGPIRKLYMDRDRENTLLGPECYTKFVAQLYKKRQYVFLQTETH